MFPRRVVHELLRQLLQRHVMPVVQSRHQHRQIDRGDDFQNGKRPRTKGAGPRCTACPPACPPRPGRRPCCSSLRARRGSSLGRPPAPPRGPSPERARGLFAHNGLGPLQELLPHHPVSDDQDTDHPTTSFMSSITALARRAGECRALSGMPSSPRTDLGPSARRTTFTPSTIRPAGGRTGKDLKRA